MEQVDTLMGECFPGQGVAGRDPCFGRPAFPFPSTPKQANASAAVLGPSPCLATEVGLQGAPLDLGPGQALCLLPLLLGNGFIKFWYFD